MSKFKETLQELTIAGYFNDKILANSLMKQYDKSNDEKKAALDKHSLLVIEKFAPHNANYKDRIRSMKSNLQFIAWILIINIVVSVIISMS